MHSQEARETNEPLLLWLLSFLLPFFSPSLSKTPCLEHGAAHNGLGQLIIETISHRYGRPRDDLALSSAETLPGESRLYQGNNKNEPAHIPRSLFDIYY